MNRKFYPILVSDATQMIDICMISNVIKLEVPCMTHLAQTYVHWIQCWALAPLGASLTANQGVAGSSPGPAAFFC